MILKVALPHQPLPEAYFNLRYEVLRKPLGSFEGSERLKDDPNSIHAWLEDEGRIISVGRVHKLDDSDDGSALDDKAQSTCPAFEPLTKTYTQHMLDDRGRMIAHHIRPACQFRQMGTDPEYRGKGYAAKILMALELAAMDHWNVESGWLQARVPAIPFYAKNGWSGFGKPYDVPNVGPHRSMWKMFE
ncbi:MAG: GNAT superfamily N-acetyltransferase [Granulosicoccus sp.]|jgi:GNAT superfamily N-acetyltransferase